MRILLLNLPSPPGTRILRDFGGGFGTAFPIERGNLQTVFPPLHEAFAAAVLEKKGFQVTILDFQIQALTQHEFLAAVEKISPHIIVSRISAPSLDSDLAVIASLKEKLPNTFLIGWGALCKMASQEVLEKSQLDMVLGEAELEFVIVKTIEKLQSNSSKEGSVQAALKTERYIDYSEEQIPRNLDALPPPALHLLEVKKYVTAESGFIPGGSRHKTISFFSVLGSHGCSFNCMYCVYPIVFGKWRGRTPEKMVDDVETLVKNYGVKVVWFEDQAFSFEVKRAMMICDEITKRGLKLNWACETRADKLSVELLKKMKRAGCTRIQLGIETGDPGLFMKLGKAGCTLETVVDNIKAIQKEGILVDTNFIVGLPGESWETVKNTASFIDRFSPDILSVSIATPYPGTQLHELAEKNKWIVTKDWNKFGLSKPIISMPTFTAQDMEKAREYLLNKSSFKRQWKLMSNDLRHGRLGKVAKDVFWNLPQVPKRLYALAKGKMKSI